MNPIKKSLQAFGAAALVMGSAMAITAPAVAQDVSLSDILRRVQQDSQQMSAEDQRRLQEFRSDAATQQQKMQQARADLNAAEARGRQLSAEFDQNERQISQLSAELETQAGDFGELLGQFRSAAGETMPIIRESLSNYEYSGRAEKLAEVSEARSLPTREDLDALPLANGQVRDKRIRADFEAEIARQFRDPRQRPAPVEPRREQRLRAERDIFQHRHLVGQREMLMHHADAGGERGVRFARRQRLAEGLDRALIGHVMAEQDVHQRCLAGAVLSEQRDHLAPLQFEGDGIIGRQRAETLGNVGEAENGLRLSAPL